MFSLIRLNPRAFLAVTRIRPHLRHFASDVPPENTSLVPALYSKKESKNPEPDHAASLSEGSPTSEDVLDPVPEPDPYYEEPYDETEVHPDDRPLRPPHGIKIDQNHGLHAFYRKFQRSVGGELVWERTAVQPKDPEKGYSGRSWNAPELRRKSFKDLHTLWYVLLRERNLLATQKEEMRRLGVRNINQYSDLPWKVGQCKKSMARIKFVINERRLTYEGAVERFARDKELGKIGAVAEEEKAKAKAKETKGKKIMVPARTQGKSKRYQTRSKPNVPTRPTTTVAVASPAP